MCRNIWCDGESWKLFDFCDELRLTSWLRSLRCGRSDVNSCLVGRSLSPHSPVSVGSSAPRPANDPAQRNLRHAVFGAARPRHVTVRVASCWPWQVPKLFVRRMPHCHTTRVRTEADESCVLFGYARHTKHADCHDETENASAISSVA